jgi:hypothetical protein
MRKVFMPLYRQAVGDWEAAHRLSLTLPKADVSAILPPASPKPAIGLYSSQHISSRPYQELFDVPVITPKESQISIALKDRIGELTIQ